ncbi:hypothetical protein P154DRAFT_623023 [Amniculicola lignicola CBS 123094]|uniref:Copper acquisition factor BIM1-like domain-containing protein n=1 Tax=Amniculicola lignicola CBS 123094 TaxID=1392246 RepID=A0A6A5W7F7_9PLEO|nr:hypothetical protein P154DRAFT_623023 [Amniculicola lignicola CBS 123094]
MKSYTFLAILSTASAHFVLETPPSIGFNDVKEAEAPCGGFDVKNRDKVTEWPVGGYPVYVQSTHTRAKWTYKAALLNSTSSFVDLIPQVGQEGLGDFCLTSIPGVAEWVGLDAVVQVAQEAHDGKLYQCAAVKFTSGNAFTPESSCKNGTGLSASFIASPTSATPTVPTSSPTSSTSSTASGSAASPSPSSEGVAMYWNPVGIAAAVAVVVGASGFGFT